MQLSKIGPNKPRCRSEGTLAHFCTCAEMSLSHMCHTGYSWQSCDKQFTPSWSCCNFKCRMSYSKSKQFFFQDVKTNLKQFLFLKAVKGEKSYALFFFSFLQTNPLTRPVLQTWGQILCKWWYGIFFQVPLRQENCISSPPPQQWNVPSLQLLLLA